MDRHHSFAGKEPRTPALIMSILLLFVCVVCFTLAFLYDDDSGSQAITMSGKVIIEAVGEGDEYRSIEDTTTSNLVIKLDDPYEVLIPGEDIEMFVNCKVYKSTTTPLLRARIDFELTDMNTGGKTDDTLTLTSDLYGQLSQIIAKNKWYLHSDGYFYYIGDVEQNGATNEDTLLKEVDATKSDAIVTFINEKIKFPTYVDSSYSGFGVQVVITFQGIQNYIPDDAGDRLENTIENSLKIFDFFAKQEITTTSPRYFDITVSGGKGTINLKSGLTEFPEVVVLPTADSDGNPITTIGTTFGGTHGIKRLIVPDSYTNIEKSAFLASDFSYIDLSDSKITEIPDNCFENSLSLKTVMLPDGLLTVGDSAFKNTALSSIVLPDSVTTLKKDCFTNTNLKILYIPKSVSSITSPFVHSTYLQRLNISSENTNFKDENGIMLLSHNGQTLYKVVYRLSGSDSLFIPEGVKTIKTNALTDAQIDNVYIPSTTDTIETDSLSDYTKHLYVDPDNHYLDLGELGAETP